MENNLIEKTQQSPENMLESVRACLEKGEFDQAARIAKQSRDTDEKPEIFSFLRTVSKADGKCPACGADEIFFFDSCHCEFTDKQPCQNCKRLAIKKAVAGKCQSIMAQRGVASRFADANLKDFPESYRGAIQTDQGVFVHGPRGTGKTHLLVALLRNEVLETEPRKGVLDDLYGDRKVYLEPHYGEFPLFVSTSEFLFEIRSSFKKSSDSTESEILSKYSNAGVLFLDDLGAEKPTDWAISTLYLLIDRRYSRMQKTYVSSNLTLDQIAAQLDDRIASRIAGMCKVVELKGRDRRIDAD